MPYEITIDRTGRVVIPAGVRRRYGLSPGSRLRLREDDGVLLLEPIPEQPVVEEKGGLLVVGGHLHAQPVDHRSLRDERADHVGGLR